MSGKRPRWESEIWNTQGPNAVACETCLFRATVAEDGSRGRITLTLLNSTIDTVRREAQRRKLNFNEYLEKLIAQQMKEDQK